MTEGEWMGDRWSMMLSLKKKKAYEEKKKKMFLFVPLSLSSSRFRFRSLSYSVRRKREKEKSKSYPLHLKQINLISSLIFFCVFIINTHKKETQLIVAKRTSAFDAVHYSSYSFCFQEFHCMWIYMK
jgi:hypothetical protein